jgi:hypothetical protein
MQFRTPDIRLLNCLFMASQEHFAWNISFVMHLLLSLETPINDKAAHPNNRLACFEKCGTMHYYKYAELLLWP